VGQKKKKKKQENRKNRIIRVGRTGNETLGADHEHPALHCRNTRAIKMENENVMFFFFFRLFNSGLRDEWKKGKASDSPSYL
jgi:hypothetical protein